LITLAKLEAIEKAIAAKVLSQREIARRLDVSRGTVNAIADSRHFLQLRRMGIVRDRQPTVRKRTVRQAPPRKAELFIPSQQRIRRLCRQFRERRPRRMQGEPAIACWSVPTEAVLID
jgi:transcriptional regulator with XRE-family HTH domain